MDTILIIEDSLVQALALQQELEEAGLSVLYATDGYQGLALADAQQPDIIVLDLEMPGISGFDVCRQLKANPKTALIPVIILTSHDEPQEFAEILDAGALDFVVKDEFAYRIVLDSIKQIQQTPATTQVVVESVEQ
ncbi:MAG TPA: response regulator [Anaerolineae bacterium]|nr:response regulator [Anaerolineae bacterium]HQK12832.1 response regulator [Anaerolineae bacterium]